MVFKTLNNNNILLYQKMFSHTFFTYYVFILMYREYYDITNLSTQFL